LNLSLNSQIIWGRKMLKLTISDANSWKRSIDAIAALIDEGSFEFSTDSMSLKAMDPSQIAMVDFEMPKKAFKAYDVAEKQSIGIDFSELSRVMRRAHPEDTITLELKGNKLEVVYEGKTKRKFLLPLIDATAHPNRPKIEFDANIKVPANDIKDVLADVELVSNYVVFDASEKALVITSESESGKAEISLPRDALLDLAVKAPSRAMFPLEYLKNMVRNTDVSTVIQIKLKKDNPLELEYPIGEGKVTYFLAPRIENP
jgi:proliferating cell nuclear antigen